jgi:hypothetical protein
MVAVALLMAVVPCPMLVDVTEEGGAPCVRRTVTRGVEGWAMDWLVPA